MFIFGGVNAIESGIIIGGAKEVADSQCWIDMPGTHSVFYFCFFTHGVFLQSKQECSKDFHHA